MNERVIQFGEAKSLVGVLAEPSGGVAQGPTVILLKLPNDLMICGMKNSIPRLAVTMPR